MCTPEYVHPSTYTTNQVLTKYYPKTTLLLPYIYPKTTLPLPQNYPTYSVTNVSVQSSPVHAMPVQCFLERGDYVLITAPNLFR